MRTSILGLSAVLAVCCAGGAASWGDFGHLTTAFLASHFVAPTTKAYFQALWRDPTDEYLAGVATWADSVRYSRWGRFTGPFHFIDAHDSPPDACAVQLDRDCKAVGCVVSALANYTGRALDASLPVGERAAAAKFIVHFVGDVHQPLHAENVARGGNGINVQFDGHTVNLHHVWDSSIAEKMRGLHRRHGVRPYPDARRWAADLATDLADDGPLARDRDGWLADLNLADPATAALAWARESNALVCSTVLPDGPEAVKDQDLGGTYYEQAAPVVERQIARAGYRMAAWLDLIAEAMQDSTSGDRTGEL